MPAGPSRDASRSSLVLEDCHWIDELSRDLLEALARAAASLPVLIVLAYRPGGGAGGGLGLERLPQFSEIVLDAPRPGRAAELDPLEARAGRAAPRRRRRRSPLVDLVTERSGGNPFYIEELLNFIAGQGIDPTTSAALRGARAARTACTA